MKKIITALVIMATMHFGAEAQATKCNTLAKHTGTTHRHSSLATASNRAGRQGRKTTTESCRIVPYQVCKINPDRKSVSCYNTTQPYADDPAYYNGAITYGSTGPMPGADNRLAAGAIVVNAPTPVAFCKRNGANDATICYSSGDLTRDDLGFYHYNLK